MEKQFARSRTDRHLAGVCGGLGTYFNIDSNLVRIAMVLIVLFMPGPGWLLYPALWLFMPLEGGGESGFEQLKRQFDNRPSR